MRSVKLGIYGLVLCALAPFTFAQPALSRPDFVWGVGVHLLGLSDNMSHLGSVSALNVNGFRDDLGWVAVEHAQGQYQYPPQWDTFIDAAIKRGIVPYLDLVYGNPLYQDTTLHHPNGLVSNGPLTAPKAVTAFAAFAQAIAAHFKGRVGWYEIWNEWAGDPADYVRLLKEAAPKIKQGDPGVKVLSGGPGATDLFKNGWLSAIVKGGGLSYVDGISVHPYVICQPDGKNAFLALLKRIRDVVGPDEPIYISEVGWPNTQKGCGISEVQSAKYMADAYLIGRCFPNVKGIWWYDLHNDGKDPNDGEANFGIYRFDWTPKPSYQVAVNIGRINNSLMCAHQTSESTDQMSYASPAGTKSFNDMEVMLLSGVNSKNPAR